MRYSISFLATNYLKTTHILGCLKENLKYLSDAYILANSTVDDHLL